MKSLNPRAVLLVAGLTLLIGLGGCITLSVQPLYQETDIITEPLLAGLWGDPDGEDLQTWQFTQRRDGGYELIVRENDTLRIDPATDGVFSATLLRLGGRMYMDLLPEEPKVGNDFYRMHVIPGHSFWRVRMEGHVLTIDTLDYEALKEILVSGNTDLTYQENEGLYVLTAPTAALQTLIIEQGDDLFSDSESMKRIR